jgi:hypothetical protein
MKGEEKKPRRFDRRTGPSIFWRLFGWIKTERRTGFDRRARRAMPDWVERRFSMRHAPLPLDAECALEHAALVLSKTDPIAHAHITQVLANHLPTLKDGSDSEGGDTD